MLLPVSAPLRLLGKSLGSSFLARVQVDVNVR